MLNKSSKGYHKFFCDGPKNEYDKRMISEIKNLLKAKKIRMIIKIFVKRILV